MGYPAAGTPVLACAESTFYGQLPVAVSVIAGGQVSVQVRIDAAVKKAVATIEQKT